MNYNRTTQKLGFCDVVYETTSEQSLDADINLPDYCPEIQRILSCTVAADLISVQNNSGRITADCNADIRILYVGENGKISSYEQNFPLQKYVESAKITSDCAVDVRVKTDYANCRAVNPRRTDVRAMLSFVFKVYGKREESLLCSAEGAGIQTVYDEHSFASLCSVSERAFSLSEVIELPAEKPALSGIINVSACALADETKIINNKALIKGLCNVKIYYIAGESGAVESVEHSMPISQIIEADGLNENCKVNINLNVTSCEAVPKADSSGNIRLMDFNIRISALAAAFEEKPLTLITDAYSTEYKSEIKHKNIGLMSYIDSFDASFTNKVILESIGVSVDSVIAVWCSEIYNNFIAKDDNCAINGTYQVNIVYKDSDNQYGIIRKPVDFDYSVKMSEKSERINCFGSVQIMSCSCAVTGDSRLEVKTELCAKGLILSCGMKKYVSEILLSEDDNIKKDSCALTIYFCDKKESLWDIARKYNTTVEAIKAENEIDADTVDNKCMLMIPANE